MEKEYTVVVYNRDDLPALEAELTASTGDGPIPARSVDIANPRLGSRIQTHFMLTDSEAEILRTDPRVRAVEIPADQRDDISIGLNGYQTGNFFRDNNDPTVNSAYVNWGLRRCIEETNIYVNRATTVTGPFEYALNGEGVDIVIQDSGIDPDHPEWLAPDGVTSRLQVIDWYVASGLPGTQSANHYGDYDGHGTHVASIAAGKIYGWAKGAHIYSQKLSGLEGLLDPGTGISIADAFDTIRLWHNKKNDPLDAAYTGRPTVVNMSWGYGATMYGDPVSGIYRGTPWTWGVDYSSRTTLLAETGVMRPIYIDGNSNTYFRIPVRIDSIDAEVEDMITDGIHVCIAAGNNLHKVDISTGPDYDNEVTFGASTYTYHRGSSPYSDNAFMVGNVNSYYNRYIDITYPPEAYDLDTAATTSTRGPGVNIWAPGSAIVAGTSRNHNGYTTATYPLDVTFPITSISGTSMASPQVCGVVACHLQQHSHLTPYRMQVRLWNDAKAVMYDSGSDVDYDRYLDSIMGSPNRMLYNRYGKQPFTGINTNIAIKTTVG